MGKRTTEHAIRCTKKCVIAYNLPRVQRRNRVCSLQKYAAKKVGHERRRGVRRNQRSGGIKGQRFGRALTTTARASKTRLTLHQKILRRSLPHRRSVRTPPSKHNSCEEKRMRIELTPAATRVSACGQRPNRVLGKGAVCTHQTWACFETFACAAL